MIYLHMEASMASGSLSNHKFLYMCFFFSCMTRTVMCPGKYKLTGMFVSLSESFFLSKLKGLRHLRIKIILVKDNLNVKEISYLLI